MNADAFASQYETNGLLKSWSSRMIININVEAACNCISSKKQTDDDLSFSKYSNEIIILGMINCDLY